MPIHCLLARGDDVLAAPGEDGWRSLSVDVEGNMMWTPREVSQALYNHFGIYATALQDLSADGHPIWLLESHTPGARPRRRLGWCPADQIEIAPGLTAADRLAAAATGRPCPWEEPGWFARACDWMERELAAAGLRRVGPITQEKTGGLSCLLVAPTADGNLWLKADHGPGPTEGLILQRLAERWADWVPEVIAVDPDSRWTLMHDIGDCLSNRLPSTPDGIWEESLRRFAEIQIGEGECVDAWRGLGCPDYTDTAAHLRALLDDGEFLASTSSPWTAQETARLPLPQVDAQITALQQAFSTISIENRDLGPHHVLHEDGRYVFFDWGFTCLAHPFLSVTRFLEYSDTFGATRQPGVRERLRDAYLEPWTALAPRAAIAEAWAAAEYLRTLHQGICWYRERAFSNPTTCANILSRPARSLRHYLDG